jgi:hypothetical protein
MLPVSRKRIGDNVPSSPMALSASSSAKRLRH